MDYVARLHLKTGTDFRQGLVDFCLNSKKQYVAIGWSSQSEDLYRESFQEYYHRVKELSGRANPAINVFKDISEEIIKRANQDDKNPIQYDDSLLLGSLINILEDSQKTRRLLSNLSYELTNMPFSQFHEGYELVDVLQSLRPKLIELYNRTDYDDWSNWVEK